jgi:hypothetical protein
MRTVRQTDMTNLVAFRNFANTPKEGKYYFNLMKTSHLRIDLRLNARTPHTLSAVQ